MLTASSTENKAAASPDSATSSDASSGAGAIETPAETPEKRAPTAAPTTQNPTTVLAQTTTRAPKVASTSPKTSVAPTSQAVKVTTLGK